MTLAITIFSPGNGLRFYTAALNAPAESIVSGPAKDFPDFLRTVNSFAERARRHGLTPSMHYHGLEPSAAERAALEGILTSDYRRHLHG